MAIDVEPVSDDSAETNTAPSVGQESEKIQNAWDTSMNTKGYLWITHLTNLTFQLASYTMALRFCSADAHLWDSAELSCQLWDDEISHRYAENCQRICELGRLWDKNPVPFDQVFTLALVTEGDSQYRG